ncbi:DUF2489 domain-containing protein [Aestuariibacter halophilus]|uniref:DUF2489 domain-containing protein n=1 Tax=Fluctibacter halophilus TaxID=226011 RepID=A0ABS8G8R1_9ALTE|nr:DUF2489 domain-containing protein [Aestuariibacter halophilus]MCC2616913.1 DUF2489 domain-containing protein [Aestuariibacter halophilus]
MISDTTAVFAAGIALCIVLPLAFYAGKLLHQLRAQTVRQNAVRTARLANLTESIQTIALAMQQQQCNLSEGAIRLVNLLEALPLATPPNCQSDYPALYALYLEVRDLPTHDARKALPRNERQAQDRVREEHEARLESAILTEIQPLTQRQW